jgi:DNA-binding beta-propeller fold protein YncE
MLERCFVAALLALAALPTAAAHAQTDINAAADPYGPGEHWGRLPDGRKFGQVISAAVDRDGRSIWIVERCGGNSCAKSDVAPIVKLDASGQPVATLGAGMFAFPHGLHVDRDGNVWATDAGGEGGKGHQVFKFGPGGKLLLTLGKAGVAGEGPDTFNRPTDVLVAPNGTIFVSDGHGPESNARIVKFAADGTFIKAWGRHGKAPGEFELPHRLAMDSAGRLFVADRANNRVQIFDQDGNFVAEWRQFGRPSGLFIDKHDMLYVADSESNAARNPGVKRGIRIGSAKDGVVTGFIPDPDPNPHDGLEPGNGSAAEGVAVDDSGTVFGAEVGPMDLKRYTKK